MALRLELQVRTSISGLSWLDAASRMFSDRPIARTFNLASFSTIDSHSDLVKFESAEENAASSSSLKKYF